MLKNSKSRKKNPITKLENVEIKASLFFFLSQDMQKGVQDQDLGFIVHWKLR